MAVDFAVSLDPMLPVNVMAFPQQVGDEVSPTFLRNVVLLSTRDEREL